MDAFIIISYIFLLGLVVPCFSKKYRSTALVLVSMAVINIVCDDFLYGLSEQSNIDIYWFISVLDLFTIILLSKHASVHKWKQIGVIVLAILAHMLSMWDYINNGSYITAINILCFLQIWLLKGGIIEFIGNIRRYSFERDIHNFKSSRGSIYRLIGRSSKRSSRSPVGQENVNIQTTHEKRK